MCGMDGGAGCVVWGCDVCPALPPSVAGREGERSTQRADRKLWRRLAFLFQGTRRAQWGLCCVLWEELVGKEGGDHRPTKQTDQPPPKGESCCLGQKAQHLPLFLDLSPNPTRRGMDGSEERGEIYIPYPCSGCKPTESSTCRILAAAEGGPFYRVMKVCFPPTVKRLPMCCAVGGCVVLCCG